MSVCRAPHCWSEYGTICGTCPLNNGVAAAVSWTYLPANRAVEALLRIRRALKEPRGWWTPNDEIDYQNHCVKDNCATPPRCVPAWQVQTGSYSVPEYVFVLTEELDQMGWPRTRLVNYLTPVDRAEQERLQKVRPT